MEIKIQPIFQWVGTKTKSPRRSQFRQTYADTKKILHFELEKLNAIESTIVISMFIHQKDIRVDGNLRANAKPYADGVILSFTRKKFVGWRDGKAVYKNIPLRYPCDVFDDWQDNLRAIALSLEALRKVERYGVFSYEEIVERLSLPSAEGNITTVEAAAEFIAKYAEFSVDEVLMNRSMMTQGYRKAALKLHPDHSKDMESEFIKLQEAKEILEKYFN